MGLQKFHAKGSGNSKPDLFFWNPHYENEIFDPEFSPRKLKRIRAGFMELKSGEHRGEIVEGVLKNAQYYGNFITSTTRYFINGKEIQNVDVFTLATLWSSTGMICKADEEFPPKELPYISETYNVIMPPFTINTHSWQRKLQQQKCFILSNRKQKILPNRINIETGIVFSKIPLDGDNISYELWVWLGNKLFPLIANNKENPEDTECIEIYIKILRTTLDGILVKTKFQKNIWLPRKFLKLSNAQVKDKEWKKIQIPRWLYKKKEDMFGII